MRFYIVNLQTLAIEEINELMCIVFRKILGLINMQTLQLNSKPFQLMPFTLSEAKFHTHIKHVKIQFCITYQIYTQGFR
jgi:hypothetical protein